MEGIVAAISNAFSLVASIFNYSSKRSDLNNSPAMQQAAQAKQLQAQEDQITKNVQEGNLSEIQKDDSAK